MEPRAFQTPQKAMKFVASAMQIGTPQNKTREAFETPKSIAFHSSGNFSLLPVVNTPPSRFPKVVNPFELGLADRLHLPLICSPSLFQRPNTPQHSSTQFEWTIEEVSSLGPANVEPHETQFQATPDPDLEAKAQAAISSYFKDQIIVPSPVECSLRNRKIALDNILNSNSPPVRSGRRIRDGIAQTVMSIPPVVPPEVEEMLKRFLTYNADQQQSPTVSCDNTIDYEAQDISLRRKLFGMPLMNKDMEEAEKDEDIYDVDLSEIENERSPPPKTPDLQTDPMPLRGFGSPFGNNSFGELSPISKLDSGKKTHECSPLDETLDNTIEIGDEDYSFGKALKSTQQSSRDGSSNTENIPNPQNQSLFRSTPDRTPAPNGAIDMSVDGSFIKNRHQRTVGNGSKNLFPSDFDNASEHSFLVADEDDMQISQLSAKSTSSSSSSQHSDTPMRRRRNRSASRRNLSRSFSCPVTDDEDETDANLFSLKKVALADRKSSPEMRVQQTGLICGGDSAAMNITERSIFYRADSGFNEMATHDESKFPSEIEDLKRNLMPIDGDISMTT